MINGCPIVTCEEVRRAERAAVEAGASYGELMRKAGHGVAALAQHYWPEGRMVVLAGPGNNGGDAFVAASRLVELGREVVVHELAPGGARTEEGQAASDAWTGERRPLSDYNPGPVDIIIDGLFGAGLSRPLEGEAARVVEAINRRAREIGANVRVLAIDVPSGVNGDRAELSGPALQAFCTAAFGAEKLAHVLQPAASLCGQVTTYDIGINAYLPWDDPKLVINNPTVWARALNWPTETSHKHGRGRLFVVSGGLAQTGAARLSAQAGLRVGAGAVTLLTPPAALMVAAGSATAVMTASFVDADALVALTARASAVIIGPAAGVNAVTRANVEALAKAGRRLVLDADALSVFSPDDGAMRGLLAAEAVLTPHAGEFERLFPGLLKASANKVEAAREGARRIGAVVLLKGFDTVIAHPDGRAVVNTMATPFLATAGSGDVLAGVIGGQMAQGLSAFDAACAGAYMHGLAGLMAGPGMTAEDLDHELWKVVAMLHKTWGDKRVAPEG